MSPSDTPSPTTLDAKYVPSDHEPRIAQRWLDARAFHADPARVLSGDREPYCILIPPPNVTARLHLGHALVNSLQDVLIRAHRMKGFETLWMPGTDHAGIATQTVVDKRLKAAGEPSLIDYKREEADGGPGREKFIQKVQDWKDDYEEQITDQLKAMGCSCDWDRQRFTMDEICARAVREAFFQLFKDGLIYRGKRLVNWDPVSQTALSDDEVEMEDVESFFWYLNYPVVDDSGKETGEHVTVATTRPETYFGDTAIAVNPEDPERARFIGKKVKLPFVGRIIPVLGDDYVVMPDPESSDSKAKYASGFLKVTPAHDTNDYEIGQRHDLEQINIMAPDASISDQHGWSDVGDAKWVLGKSREDARELVEQHFRDAGLLAGKKPYAHAVGHSYRSHVPVEPYLSDQWYCKVSDDRLVGSAQRALALDQRTEQSLTSWPESRPSAGGMGFQPVPLDSDTSKIPARLSIHRRHLPHWQSGGSTYFITFRVKDGELSPEEREMFLDACFHFHNDRYTLHLATVMPDHVHLLITPKEHKDGGWWPLQDLIHSIKSFSSNQINSTRGTGGPLWQQEYYDRLVRDHDEFVEKWNYMLMNPVRAGLVPQIGAYNHTRRGDADDQRDGLEAHPTGEDTDGSLCFSPARYAKTYEAWHDGLRDWCISRQLWWGHRIPVWRMTGMSPSDEQYGDLGYLLEQWESESRVAVHRRGKVGGISGKGFEGHFQSAGNIFVCIRDPADTEIADWLQANDLFTQDPDVLDTWFSSALWPLSTMGWPNANLPRVTPRQIDPADASSIRAVWVKRVGTWKEFIGSAGDESGELIDRLLHMRDNATTADGGRPLSYQLFREAELQSDGTKADALADPKDIQDATDLICAVGIKEQAPVESTKYGAIHVETMLLKHGFQDTAGLLEAFNPSSVLCTGRDIITLWVSRMAMFNRFFTGGTLPFTDVYINPIVQDGHGQRMSKSLGNGVDPLDIIHSHGADALRMVLCQIATSTQDVRMPVDTVCPHTGDVFEPETITTSAGHVVAAPIQSCPSDPSKKMVTAYGVASGLASATDEMPQARNTSSRFDIGRNICTKLWNAARFAMMILEESDAKSSDAVDPASLGLVDRWMLGRLSKAVAEIDEAIATYTFSKYAELVYDLLWRDFCDWYLEAIKPTVRTNPGQQAVLHAALDTILRVLHPITPFVTEVLSERLNTLPRPGSINGVQLPRAELLCVGAWPSIEATLHDGATESRWGEVQSLVEAIRQSRAQQNVPNRQKLTLHGPRAIVDLVEACGPVVPSLAGLAAVTTDAPEGASVELLYEGDSLRLSGLDEGIDPEKLKAQLTDRQKKLTGEIRGLEGRLNNPGYVQKAPAKLVDETKAQLASKQAELADIESRLKELV